MDLEALAGQWQEEHEQDARIMANLIRHSPDTPVIYRHIIRAWPNSGCYEEERKAALEHLLAKLSD